jgi:hypothetical protein
MGGGRSVDAGGPLFVWEPSDDGDGVSVDARFETLDVERRSVVFAVRAAERDDDDGSLYATSDPTRVTCLLDTGACTADDDDAAAFLADRPWFEEGLQRHMDHVRQRAWRAVAQRDRETAARRVLATAAPGKMLAFHDLFPADWDLLFSHDDALYWIVDLYCPNPACDCSSVALTLYHLRKGAPAPLRVGEAQVDLASERPLLEVSTPAARELFAAFWNEHEERLRPRRDEARRAVLRHAPPPATSAPAAATTAAPVSPARPPRNAPCPCGSGKKYKRCCLGAPLHSSARPGPAASRS